MDSKATFVAARDAWNAIRTTKASPQVKEQARRAYEQAARGRIAEKMKELGLR